jgi:hypothetical protein
MSKLLANAVVALSLMLPASVASPAWSAGTGHSQKCSAAKHKHAKRVASAKPQPARGGTLVEHRKLDVQILSFGP